MYNILLFAGTSEGRQIADALKETKISTCVFTATEYGGSLIQSTDTLHVHVGRLDEDDLKRVFTEHPSAWVIDATHPYAAVVTQNLKQACEETNHRYMRVLRSGTEYADQNAIVVASTDEAVSFLSNTTGNVLLTTGSKELAAYTGVPDYKDRLFARVLPLPKVIDSCVELGFSGVHLMSMQGPFSEEMNVACIHQTKATYLVTKDTGEAGGFPEKVSACQKTGCRLVIIDRPLQENGLSVDETISIISEEFAGSVSETTPETDRHAKAALSNDKDKNISVNTPAAISAEIGLIGIGMGNEQQRSMTLSAAEFCAEADLLIGARRMLDSVDKTDAQKELEEYRSQQIVSYLEEHPEIKRAAILLSGDVGFFSGAKKLLQVLPETAEVFPGISSLVYFCAKIHTSWDDVKITSSHGRSCNLIGEILTNRKVFSIMGTSDGVKKLCEKITAYGSVEDGRLHAEAITITIGECLGYDNEKILSGKPSDFVNYEGDPLSVVLIENSLTDGVITPGIPDEAYLRDKVPMTKEEIREISICKLQLTEQSVIYDVGAGSGSVSIQAAVMAKEGQVFAIEKNPTAVDLLYKNKLKFAVDNLEIIEGLAPEALEELPVPTHAFIGGSSGNMVDILRVLLHKNPDIRVVVNAITLETIHEAVQAFSELPFKDVDICSVSVAKSKTLGKYHMMFGQNPIYIISANGGAIDE